MKIKHLTIIAAVAVMATACVNKPKTEEKPQPKLIDKYAEYILIFTCVYCLYCWVNLFDFVKIPFFVANNNCSL